MSTQSNAALAELHVSDVAGHRSASVSNIPHDCKVCELVEELLSELNLPRNDGAGRPLVYHARLDREGRHLQGGESVGESLQSGDRVVLTPNIEAGAPGRVGV